MSLEVSPLVAEGRKLVTSYGDGLFRFGEETVTGSILLFPEAVYSWGVTSTEDITPQSFSRIIENAEEIDILLLGMGSQLTPVPLAWRQALKEHGIVIEPMDTGAACRTYNVLVAEARRVAAAMIAV
ncbi:Mth938-like domain-containing protein [Thalassospira australica]|uniref:Mth938-like domain-containing protein n=1 Tax=Thalassospira australica TaxID=1528106 RepID=UPI00051A194C|nr:Mth938-like domain-containing protein [Thalassospira australica]